MTNSNNSYLNEMGIFRLGGRRALITGGAKGLGRVISQALAEAGAEVVIAGRTAADCQRAAQEIADLTGRRAIGVAADVTRIEDLQRLKDQAETSLGAVDILVNNAGINIRGSIEELSEADFSAVINTNLTATFLGSKIFGPPMTERGWGRVINL